MLTKDLVQATVRSGKLFPKFIKAGDAKAIADAESICELFGSSAGRIVGEVEEDIKALGAGPRSRAFAKIMMDESKVAEPGAEVLDLRWKMFQFSEAIRREGVPALEDLHSRMAGAMRESVDRLQQKIFADLPSARILEGSPDIGTKELIERYNLSHVTTFLCLADDVSISVSNLSVPQKRELMRRLKFNRLMSDVEVNRECNELHLELSGPLKIFGKIQGYSLRIAHFFPFIASLPEWKLKSSLTWKGKKVSLELDHSCGVIARSVRGQGGYIPREFQDVLVASADMDGIKMIPGDDFIHLGRQSYCFPDFTVQFKNRELGIELFHPWHKGQAKQRIEAATACKTDRLLIGVDRSLLKDPDLRLLCEKSVWFAKYGFEFSQFPTPNILRKAILRHD
jgi:hypothetical protein